MLHIGGGGGDNPSHHRFLEPALVAVAAMMSVIGSLGAPLVPTIALDNHVSISTAQWMLTGALLSGALATPVMGRLADGAHRRRVLLISLSIVLIGSVLAALSRNFSELLVGRGMQGVGLGLLPVTMAVARRELSAQRASRVIATLSVTAAVGVGLGYPITSLLAQSFSYHASFWFGAIMIALALVLVAVVIPPDTHERAPSFDYVGAIALDLRVVGLMIALSEGGTWGWTSIRSLAVIVGSLVVITLWSLYELQLDDPLVNLRQVRLRAVLTADVSAFLISFAMYLFIPITVEFVQVPRSVGYGFGQSIFVAGLLLLPLSVGTFLSSRLQRVVAAALGVRVSIPIGAMIFATAALLFALDHRALWVAFVSVGLAGVGAGFTYAAMPGFIVRAVPLADTGSATGFYQVIRSIGLSVGSAVATSILARSTLHGATYPTVEGFSYALYTSGALCVVVAVVSWLLPGKSPTHRSSAQIEELMAESGEIGATSLMLANEPLRGLDPASDV